MTVMARAEPYVVTTGFANEFEDVQQFHNEWCPIKGARQGIRPIGSADLSRVEASLMVICYALSRAAGDYQFKYIPYPNYSRMLLELEKGRTVTMLDLPWQQDAQSDLVYSTDAVISVGQFEKGFYVSSKNAKAQAVSTVQELLQLDGVSSRNWYLDWLTLTEFGMHPQDTATFDAMIRMVDFGRADFLLGEFPRNADLNLHYGEVTLVPVRNFKLAIPVSRHIVISRKAPHAAVIHQAMQKGLDEIRQDGTLKQILASAGIPNPHVREWATVCCQNPRND